MGVKHIDLFSGIGGFSLAAERVGWETVAFCETDEFCRRVIERRFDRVRWISLPGLEPGGEALGLAGDEKLSGLDPDWLVIENTYHRWRAWVPELRRRLHGLGYASLPLRVRASEVGARHQRARAWVVAHADSERLRQLSRWWGGPGREMASEFARDANQRPGRVGITDGVPPELDRRRAIGNAIYPKCAELIFRAIEAVR